MARAGVMEQKRRILKFVSDAYDSSLKDGTKELELTMTIYPMYERFDVRKNGIIKREIENGRTETI